MQTRFAFCLAAALFALPILAGSAISAGGGGGGGGGSGGGSSGGSSSGGGSSATECRSGKVWDKKRHKCVEPKQGMLDDDSLYEAGRGLAMAGRYGEAITVLGYVANKADPRVLNYLGYSHRKSGRIQVGLGYYEEALRINPDYILAREYLGEAYLTLGDLASAQGQLNEIYKRCGKGCREYSLLSQELARFEKIWRTAQRRF